jgi:hypothetical protein
MVRSYRAGRRLLRTNQYVVIKAFERIVNLAFTSDY